MWENELIVFWFSFYLLIGIFILLLANLVRAYIDHKELIDVLRHLPTYSQCKQEDAPPDKENDS